MAYAQYQSNRKWAIDFRADTGSLHMMLGLADGMEYGRNEKYFRVGLDQLKFGLSVAAVGTRYFESMLFGLKPLDPATFILVPVGFVLVSALATYVPARRATRVDPLIALRQE
jgi:putative ABC transport system permease protein